MDIRMIVTDLDGTFLRTDKSVSAYSQQIIQQCREKGIIFVIATARPVRAVKSFLPFLSCDAAIYHNGAVVRLGEKTLDGYGIPNPEKYIFLFWRPSPIFMCPQKYRIVCMPILIRVTYGRISHIHLRILQICRKRPPIKFFWKPHHWKKWRNSSRFLRPIFIYSFPKTQSLW